MCYRVIRDAKRRNNGGHRPRAEDDQCPAYYGVDFKDESGKLTCKFTVHEGTKTSSRKSAPADRREHLERKNRIAGGATAASDPSSTLKPEALRSLENAFSEFMPVSIQEKHRISEVVVASIEEVNAGAREKPLPPSTSRARRGAAAAAAAAAAAERDEAALSRRRRWSPRPRRRRPSRRPPRRPSPPTAPPVEAPAEAPPPAAAPAKKKKKKKRSRRAPPPAEISEYERTRMRNIAAGNKKLYSLGLIHPPPEVVADPEHRVASAPSPRRPAP
ncbi:hypothetical protein JL720_15728 [Aureococcus anophagefferens]|nr:hypothetical protein JL720_15728 [Aureococcus anophagefferens]